jgi:NADH-quinone oxidoreductase subunit M
MTLVWLIALPLAAGAAAWAAARQSPSMARWLCLLALLLGAGLTFAAWMSAPADAQGPWAAEARWDWIPQFGIAFHLAMDGLSFVLVLLTYFLGIMALLASWREVQTSVGFFHMNLMWITAGIVGVFLAIDLFLFYFAWEVMLIPMYFLISIWGHERRNYAAVKFFIFTQLSGLFMLVAILALYFAHGAATGIYTFSFPELLGTPLSPDTARLIMLGFFIAFAVKMPAFPFHTWLPDAHTQAPTAGSVILAGLMLKTGGYGLMRFVFPLFPDAAREFAPVAMTLAVAGIIYGAILAFAQTDLKRLVAYTSVSHLGFVLLGIFAWNSLGLQGAVLTMVAHGLSTGALFILAGALQDRLHTREMGRMGGLWSVAPFLSGSLMFFMMASIGLPGLADFVGEFLTLAGAWRINRAMTTVAAIGILAATLYGLRLIQRTLHGPNANELRLPDLSVREAAVVALMSASLIWLGIYPRPAIDSVAPALETLQQQAAPRTITVQR